MQFSIGENYEAIESFNEAIKLNNEFEEPYLNLGNVYKELGKDKQALECFEKARGISPDNSEILREIEELKAK
ncbi:tetratricopeptide repeat protein [Methanobacterium oryzae]|uniref:tetratricopeptide repeat protein n=1 Tax=Methanobacterium oryzae TaxID=69540 RepID=UPI003D1A2E78